MALKDMLKSPHEVSRGTRGCALLDAGPELQRICEPLFCGAKPAGTPLITPMHRHERNDERALDECRQRVHVEAAHPKLDAPLLRGADVPG